MEPQLLCHLQELLRRTAWIAEQQLRTERLLQAMEGRLGQLEGRLQAVEGALLSLENRLSEMEDQPSTRIDKIEYHFEQLKVDTLAGTLQIGVAHGADGIIDDLTAGQTVSQDVKLSGAERGEPYVSIGGALEEYMGSGLYADIDTAASEAGWAPMSDPGLRETVAEDLRKQIRRRSAIYMKEIPSKEGKDEAAVKAVLERVRKDVRTGLKQFYESEGKGQEP